MITWDADRPIKKLPEKIKDIFRSEAISLRRDLNEIRLEVALVPAPDPRVCEFFDIESDPNMFPEHHPYWLKHYIESSHFPF